MKKILVLLMVVLLLIMSKPVFQETKNKAYGATIALPTLKGAVELFFSFMTLRGLSTQEIELGYTDEMSIDLFHRGWDRLSTTEKQWMLEHGDIDDTGGNAGSYLVMYELTGEDKVMFDSIMEKMDNAFGLTSDMIQEAAISGVSQILSIEGSADLNIYETATNEYLRSNFPGCNYLTYNTSATTYCVVILERFIRTGTVDDWTLTKDNSNIKLVTNGTNVGVAFDQWDYDQIFNGVLRGNNIAQVMQSLGGTNPFNKYSYNAITQGRTQYNFYRYYVNKNTSVITPADFTSYNTFVDDIYAREINDILYCSVPIYSIEDDSVVKSANTFDGSEIGKLVYSPYSDILSDIDNMADTIENPTIGLKIENDLTIPEGASIDDVIDALDSLQASQVESINSLTEALQYTDALTSETLDNLMLVLPNKDLFVPWHYVVELYEAGKDGITAIIYIFNALPYIIQLIVYANIVVIIVIGTIKYLGGQ